MQIYNLLICMIALYVVRQAQISNLLLPILFLKSVCNTVYFFQYIHAAIELTPTHFEPRECFSYYIAKYPYS